MSIILVDIGKIDEGFRHIIASHCTASVPFPGLLNLAVLKTSLSKCHPQMHRDKMVKEKKKKKNKKNKKHTSDSSDSESEEKKKEKLKKVRSCFSFVHPLWWISLVDLQTVSSSQALEAEDKRVKQVDALLQLDERKRPYNSLGQVKAPSEEEMEAFRMKRCRPDDPMASFLGQ